MSDSNIARFSERPDVGVNTTDEVPGGAGTGQSEILANVAGHVKLADLFDGAWDELRTRLKMQGIHDLEPGANCGLD